MYLFRSRHLYPVYQDYSTTLDLCPLLCCFDVQFVTFTCSFWTSTMLPHSFNVQSDTLSCSFWTSACLPQLQRPIHHGFLLLLDLCLLPRSFDVQSDMFSCSFWTSSMPPTASTSNSPRFLAPFGLPPCLPQLQRPIHHGFLLLLDFYHASRSFNVQSVTVSCSFWTSACFPAT